MTLDRMISKSGLVEKNDLLAVVGPTAYPIDFTDLKVIVI